MRSLGLYIHIPFCKAKCIYCDFYSLPHSEEKMDAYTAALQRDLIRWADQAKGHTVDTIYFGGGTPSFYGAARLIELLDAVNTGSGKLRGNLWYSVGRYVYVPLAVILCCVALFMHVAF